MPNNNVDQIKNRLGIVEVVGSYLKLEKAGINFKARCPFHNEKTPSFFVSPSRESFYCFGCGKKGDIFNFVQEFEGVDFLGSLKILADKAGIKLEKIDPKTIDQKERLYAILEKSANFYQKKLSQNKEALEYLKKRGLNEKTLTSFRLGFAPDAWQELLAELEASGYKQKEIEKAGLAKTKDGRSQAYDRFRSRIIFPVMDASGRVIAFSGRIFPPEKEGAKYLNSPETELFKKSEILFGYDKAKLQIRRNDFAILVEGNVDVLMAHQAGYSNTLAPLGTALTKEQVDKLLKLSRNLVIAFDSDSAGFKASERGAKIALAVGMDLKVASMREASDPAELIAKNPQNWKEAIRESKPIVEFYLQKLEDSVTDRRKLGLKIREEVLPFVVMVENKIDQAHFVKILSEKLDISQETVMAELQKIEVKNLDLPSFDKAEENSFSGKELLSEKAVKIILWQKTLKKSQIDLGVNSKKIQTLTGNKAILEDPDNLDEITFEMERTYEPSIDLQKILDEIFLKIELQKLKNDLKQAEKNKDEKLSMEILKKYQILSKELENLKEKNY